MEAWEKLLLPLFLGQSNSVQRSNVLLCYSFRRFPPSYSFACKSQKNGIRVSFFLIDTYDHGGSTFPIVVRCFSPIAFSSWTVEHE